jgi:anti-sigma regulatory factor (Ser/Thr protein kinase)
MLFAICPILPTGHPADRYRLPIGRQMRKETTMAGTAVEIDPQLIKFMLPGIPESARIARFHIRAALGFHDLGHLADDAEIITSELVTNAVHHAGCDVTETIGVTLARTRDQDSVIVVVSDSSPHGPVMRAPSADSEPGRGLQIVASLSVRWGWHPEPHGKAVYAILATETDA